MRAADVSIVTPTARTLLGRARAGLAIAAIVVAASLALLVLPQASYDDRVLGADNRGPEGSRALVSVLEDHGVDVEVLDDAAAVVDRADEATTVVVAFPSRMSLEIADAIAGLDSPVVYIGTEQLYGDAIPGLRADILFDEESGAPVGASCDAPAARAARTLPASTYGVGPDARGLVDSHWDLCFPQGTDVDGLAMYGYAQSTGAGPSRAVIADSAIVRNRSILDEGSAALALHAIGGTDRVIWYVADFSDSLSEAADVDAPWTIPLLVLGSAGLILIGAARGRRLGRLVPEELPAHVPAAETLIGKARLLRRAKARGRAADSLRASCAERLARSLGVAPSADANALAGALARAGVEPSRAHALLWGPAPTTDRDLVALIHDLDDLEKEIRHD
ncbi:DUF4350 domain-containing protein [Actinomyces sp. B33]|uniref:DUF4350 domain-containing protein n=1 Tax=Actinomyces sp. B33 TaxID=2942131 RepID=UPI0023416ABF|nr:DUF4350 domain-containing protein [Actinomyces sp. B33]MDC4232670.1 DUF4350 domain-containing protein [Actinomyces sp. B33]